MLEAEKALINRRLVKDHLYAEGYDEVCHHNDDSNLPKSELNLKQLKSIQQDVLLSDKWD